MRSPAGRSRIPRQGGAFSFEPRMHDDGEKVGPGPHDQVGRRKEGRRAGARHPGQPPVDRAVHRDEARAAVRRRRAAPGAGRSRGATLPRNQRRHPRGRAHDRHVAGVLRRRGLSRQGQDAVRVRRQRRARDRHGHGQRAAARCGGAQPRHAALRVPAADRLLGQGRRVGQHRRAPQPHELCGVADCLETGAQRGRWHAAAAQGQTGGRPTITSEALVASALAGELSEATAATVARADDVVTGAGAGASARPNSREGRTP